MMAVALDPNLCIAVDESVELRPLRIEDAEMMYYLVHSNRQHLEAWLPWVHSIRSVADEATFIRHSSRDLAAGTNLSCAIVVERSIVGMIGCSIESVNHSADIGYWMTTSSEGRGLVTRAAQVLTDFLVTEINVRRVTIRAATENTRSRAVAERLGFVHEGTQRDAQIINGDFCDLEIYSMLAPEWFSGTLH
tara:strand:+ start:3180 stop:3755 length:576 start_codon:yes stop_codon:yes gene_type:complete